jgi:transmembrane sensor
MRPWIRWGAIAASLAVVAVMLTVMSGALPPFWADVHIGTGEQRTLPLADGSRIVLNTQAAVSIRYSGEIRRVDLLAGEAAFQVAKDAARPFVVQVQGGEVRAAGTEFIVHRTNKTVVVTVTDGVVDVTASGDRVAIPARVQAGQRVQYGASGIGPIQPVDLRVATAWQRGKLIFEAAPIETVVEEINRYRPGRVLVLNDALARHPVSGVFDLDRLDTAVSTIEQTLPVTTYRLFDRFVIFR